MAKRLSLSKAKLELLKQLQLLDGKELSGQDIELKYILSNDEDIRSIGDAQ